MLHGDPHPPLSRRLRRAVLLALASAGLVVTATQAVFAGTAAPVATAAADPQPAKAVMTDSSVVTLARAGGNPAPGSKATATAHDDAAPAPGHAVAATSQSEATRGRAAPALEFRAPLSTRKISSRYGASGGSRTRPHRGIDFAAARGTPVLAAAAGVVAAATTRYPEAAIYGTVVVIDHGQGWQTLYAHLADFSVAPGQRMDDGFLTVTVFSRYSKLQLWWHFFTIAFGRREYRPKAVALRVKKLRLDGPRKLPVHLDGTPQKGLWLAEISCLPHSLLVFR